MLFLLTLTTISIGFVEPIYSDYINREVQSSCRATVLSIQNFIASVVSLIFASVLGFSNNIGFSFIVVGILILPAYILIIYKIKVNENKTQDMHNKNKLPYNIHNDRIM